jgi:uncharacterized RDD family membrane protein YckC
MNYTTYGTLIKRVKAIIFDLLVLVGLGLLATSILERFENSPDSARLIAFAFVFFLYDPLFTSFAGGTIGHLIMGLRVKREPDEEKNIIFPLAIVRFIIKAFLGWISLLTVSGNTKKKALHDMIVNSVVIVKK